MASVTLFSVTPFDATKEYTFTFDYTGSEPLSNTIQIKNNSTSAVRYTATATHRRMSHTIPAGKLKNGTTYSVQISVLGTDGVQSDWSTAIIFKCLTTPVFAFKNLTSGQVIKNVSFQTELSYSQKEGEKLNSFYILLYDENQQIVHQSPTIYNINQLNYVLEGLNNNRSYFIKAHGQTVSGIVMETAFIPFSVEYILPNMFSMVQVENNDIPGTITIKSNLILVEGKYDGKPVFINGAIDLRNGTPVIFDEGFDVNEDFSLQMIISEYIIGKPVLTTNDGNMTLIIHKANIYGQRQGKEYVQLKDRYGMFTYTLDSNYFTPGKIQINLRKAGGLYTLEVI